MNAAQLLLVTAAGALLLAAGYTAQRQASENSEDDTTEPDWTDTVDLTLATARNTVMPSPAGDMGPSQALADMLKRGEALRLTRYRLGDGGWTIGYGRYFPDGGAEPPVSITVDQAEAWFADDLEARGARWVRAYVTVPLTQNQFDALVSMAFNLKPSSFKTIADAVNAGDDPEAAALRYVRAGTNLENGLRNRRGRELALYRTGIYA
jgi:lysozyme